MNQQNLFSAGRNIAMKVPPHLWDATVRFYREIVGLETIEHEATTPPSVGFKFGACQLWIDRVESVSQAELWLELVTNDLDAAAARLKSAGAVRCDEIEKLPDDFAGFWIQSPASIVHLVARPSQ